MALFPKDCYPSNQKKKKKQVTGDYHDEMNSKSFRDWLQCVLPELKDKTVIVMDNAPYHSVKVEKSPTPNLKKRGHN